jgi:hypothetical protein
MVRSTPHRRSHPEEPIMEAGPTTTLLDAAPPVAATPRPPLARPRGRTLSAAAAAASPAVRLVLAAIVGRGAGEIGSVLLPQGPSSPGAVLVSLTAGLAVGAVVGRMTPTRWGAVVASVSGLLAVGIGSPLLLALTVPIALGALVVPAYDRHAHPADVLAAAVAAFCLGLVTVVLLWPVLPAPTLAVDDDGLPALMEMDR